MTVYVVSEEACCASCDDGRIIKGIFSTPELAEEHMERLLAHVRHRTAQGDYWTSDYQVTEWELDSVAQ